MQRLFFAFGSGFALIAVITGAFAAHALKTRLSPDMFTTFEVAARYQMYHALGLIAVAWAASQWSSQLVHRVRLVICGWHRYFFGKPLYPITNRCPLARRHNANRWSRLHPWLGLSPMGDNKN